MFHVSRKCFFGSAATFVFVLVTVTIHQTRFYNEDYALLFTQVQRNPKFESSAQYIVDTPGCQIPNMDPFDPEVRPVYSYVRDIECPKTSSFVTVNRTHLMVNRSKVQEEFGEDIKCGYRKILREGNGETDNKFLIDDTVHEVFNAVMIEEEFIMFECKKQDETVYTDFFPFIQVKYEVEERCNTKPIQEKMSVTMVGVDSISRLNMLRHMPKTFNFLKSLNAIDLQGYTKVADNTFINVVPLLSGLFVDECWNETLDNVSLNYLNLIWKDYSENGFRTLFAEDFPKIATFNYLKSGFYDQPTDYYFRPFTLAASKFLELDEGCYNSRLEVDVVMQWLLDFHETFNEKPTFAYVFNTRLTHGGLNDAGYADQPYYNFLNNFYNSNFNNNTVLIFFSDHGMRFGAIRKLYIGKIEERMPFFFLVFPPWFQFQYPEIYKNLRINQNRLTTPFDIYETLKDLLYFSGTSKTVNLSQRGISLFSEIPPFRTCEDAAILPHWCVCNQRTKIDINEEHVVKAANKLIDVINNNLIGEKQCAVLSIEKILDARLSELSDQLLSFESSKNDVINRTVKYGDKVKGVINYLITFSASPGGGLFEGTVEYFEISNLLIASGDISRINEYGNQSSCINNHKLHKFCYCIKYSNRI